MYKKADFWPQDSAKSKSNKRNVALVDTTETCVHIMCVCVCAWFFSLHGASSPFFAAPCSLCIAKVRSEKNLITFLLMLTARTRPSPISLNCEMSIHTNNDFCCLYKVDRLYTFVRIQWVEWKKFHLLLYKHIHLVHLIFGVFFVVWFSGFFSSAYKNSSHSFNETWFVFCCCCGGCCFLRRLNFTYQIVFFFIFWIDHQHVCVCDFAYLLEFISMTRLNK